MSFSYDVFIAYGFAIEQAIPRDFYIEEWLEANRFGRLSQLGAGASNGGAPDHLIGIPLFKLRDTTRGRAYLPLPDALPYPSDRLEQLVVACSVAFPLTCSPVGFFLCGELT